ncbi:MAG: ABC transporter substrate-binding protein [Afipia felis]|nr:ABC transporter substrate-binding protein [Afipia felis]
MTGIVWKVERRAIKRVGILAKGLVYFASIVSCVGWAGLANAEVSTVRIAKQYGVAYLPLTVMENHKLLEKHAKELGLDIKTEWMRFASGSAMNDGLLSGGLDFAAGGLGPMILMWSKTQDKIGVKAVGALCATPLHLVTTNPSVKSIADFTSKDRIAMPGIKTSYQALLLQQALIKKLGPDYANKLDAITVALGHPDAMAAVLGGQSEVNSHFTSPPFYSQEMADPRVRSVLNSYDVFGAPLTFTVVWATTTFANSNPKVMKAFTAALDEAMARINADPDAAAKIWMDAEHPKISDAEAKKIVRDPETKWTTAPQNIFAFYQYMHKVGIVTAKAMSWKDMFFPSMSLSSGS